MSAFLAYPLNTAPDSSLAASGTVTPDATTGVNKSITQTGNLNFGAPINAFDGAKLIFRLTMGGAGGFSRTWDAAYGFEGDLTGLIASTSVDSVDIVGFEYVAAFAKWYCFSFLRIK